jgi:hypothetical protein
VVDELVDDDGCELGDLVAKSLQITAKMGANVIFDGLDNLS